MYLGFILIVYGKDCRRGVLGSWLHFILHLLNYCFIGIINQILTKVLFIFRVRRSWVSAVLSKIGRYSFYSVGRSRIR